MSRPDQDHDPLAQAARRLLRESEHHLDALTVTRLSGARRHAVAQMASPRPWWQVLGQRWPALAGACAAALLIVLLVPRAGRPPLDAEAFDYATAADAALYEDLEFYLWADDLDPAGSPPSPS
jgi:hypothetical protein